MSLGSRIVSRPSTAFEGHSADGGFNGNYTAKLPTGVTYRQLIFKLKNIDIDQIEEVELMLNGDPLVRVSGENLDMIRKSTGAYRSVNDDILVLPFTDTTQTAMVAQNWSELATGPNENLVLKVRTGARKSGQAGLVASFQMWYELGPAREERTRVPRILTDGLPGNKVGSNNYQRLISLQRAGSQAWIQRIYFDNPAVNNVKVIAAGRDIFDKTKEMNNFSLLSNGQLPLDDMYMIDSVSEGFGPADSIADASTIEFELNLDTAGSFEMIAQYVQLLPAPVKLR